MGRGKSKVKRKKQRLLNKAIQNGTANQIKIKSIENKVAVR